ncbi:excalibur calcium-binding domain-containing protein [Asticcacaulis sp. W401b]|uniref:excalibur calcium-binding domain-containing protein n=1 Tax=Asticcacaulis sp. W401b TaxID=3388666 RepID=UPI003970D4C0
MSRRRPAFQARHYKRRSNPARYAPLFILVGLATYLSYPRVVRLIKNEPAYYSNCSTAKAAGVAPIYRWEPGYRAAMDRDGDGVACEPWR